MLVYLLLPALLLGDVEPQRLNATEDELNATFTTVQPRAETPGPSGDPWTQTADPLQGNQTWVFLTEEEEGFQDQAMPFPWRHCHWDLLAPYGAACGDAFRSDMLAVGADGWCVPRNVIWSYSQLTYCLEAVHHSLGCFFPSADVQDFFLDVHAVYFRGCAGEDVPGDALEDVPLGTLAVLTLAPVGLIPPLVYMVGWKSKVAA